MTMSGAISTRCRRSIVPRAEVIDVLYARGRGAGGGVAPFGEWGHGDARSVPRDPALGRRGARDPPRRPAKLPVGLGLDVTPI